MSIDFSLFFRAAQFVSLGSCEGVGGPQKQRLHSAEAMVGNGAYARLTIGLLLVLWALPASAQTVVLEYDFETPGDTEGWSVLNPGSHPIAHFSQRNAVNGSEGVLYGEVSTNDPQLDLRQSGVLTLPEGYSWGKAEFRVRHLEPDGQGGFTPRAFSSSGAHFSVLNASNAFQNLTNPLSVRDGGGGWTWMTYSLAGLGSGNMTPNRFDPIGGNAAIGDAFEIDHARFTAYPPADPNSLNVVFIMADDLGWSDTTLYGTTALYETPNIERLAARGMTFTRAYTASPLCSPTRASILTGQTNARNGSTAPQHHLETVRLQAAVQGSAASTSKSRPVISVSRLDTAWPTLGKQLAAAGIRTGHFGKWHLGRSPYTPLEHGFDLDIPNWFGPGPQNGFIAPWSYPNLSPNSPDEHIEDRMAEEAVNWMQSVAQQQFYLQYWQFSVHAPFDAKESLIDYYRPKIDLSSGQRSPTYAAMVHSLDDAVGTLLDAIDALGLAHRTVIIFYSDNGGNMYNTIPETDVFGQPFEATPTSNSPLRGGKGGNWDGGVRVPMIVVWPGVTEPGSQSDALTQSTDFYPTILNIMEAELPPEWPIDGVDITPTFAGEAFDRGPIFNYFPHSPPAVPDQLRPSISVHKDNWKLIRLFHEGEAPGEHAYHLFDLAEDIGEQNELAAAEPAKVAELDALIEAHLLDADAVVPLPNPAYWAALWGEGSIWTGGSGPHWNNAGNWLELPGGASDLIFSGSRNAETVNNFPVGTTFGAIRFEPPFAAFTLSGNSITSGDIRIGTGTGTDAPVTHTLTLDMHQSGTRLITTSANASLHIEGNLSGSGNLDKQGEGLLLLSGNNTFSGVLQVLTDTMQINTFANTGEASSIGSGNRFRVGHANSDATLILADSPAAQSTDRFLFVGSNAANHSGSATLLNNNASPAHSLTFTASEFNATQTNTNQDRYLALGGTNTGANTIQGVIRDNSANARVQLRKTGSGSWHLAGDNTFSGGLSVEEGTLVLSGSQSFSGNTTVFGGATFQLTDGGSMRLTIGESGVHSRITGEGSVAIDGVLHFDLNNAGTMTGDVWTVIDVEDITYGPTFTVAAFEALGNGLWLRQANDASYVFSQNSGLLKVGAPYAVWISEFDLSEADRAPEATPAGDGISNLLKYALGLGPTSTAAAPFQLPRLANEADNFSFEAITRNNDPALTVHAEASIDLADWSATLIEWNNVDQTETPIGFSRRVWNGESGEASEGRLFFRLRALLNP